MSADLALWVTTFLLQGALLGIVMYMVRVRMCFHTGNIPAPYLSSYVWLTSRTIS